MSKTAPVDMYDSVTPDNIPSGAQVVAGYVDGDYAWKPEGWARHSAALKATITVKNNIHANVADVENGDLTPAQARAWIMAKEEAGIRGTTIYCSRSTLVSVRYACQGLNYYVWVADWTNEAHAIPGTVATQFANPGPYDISMVYSQEWLDLLDEVNRDWQFG